MTLILKLSEELEQRLEAQAEQKHLSVSEYAVQLLEQNSALTQRRNQAIDFLQSLRESAAKEEEEGEDPLRAMVDSEGRFIPNPQYYSPLPESDIPLEERNKRAIALLQSWIDASDEEIAEQKETGEYLIRVLDEDRSSDRKLFPSELKGISW